MRSFLALSLLSASLLAQAAPERIADGVYLQRGGFEPGRQPDGNSVLLRGNEGWVLIDSGRHAAHTQALLDFASPIKAAINTHWHLDHLGGNALLRRAQPGLVVWASPAVDEALKGWLANSREQMQGLVKDERVPESAKAQMRIDLALLDEPRALAPDRHIGGTMTLNLAGRALRVGRETAVSGGDVWVLDEASGTLALGDLVTLPVPFLDTACADDWPAALQRMEAMPFERVVPGHGPVLSRSELGRYREALSGLLACAATDKPVADCASAWLDTLGSLVVEADKPRAIGMLGYYFKQHLRNPQRQRFCTP